MPIPSSRLARWPWALCSFAMLSEIAALHEVPLSTETLEMVGRQMAQTLFKLGIAEAAGSVLAGIFKFNPLGFAAGGIVQATTMAYLTRVIGDSFLEYLERGQAWGEGGMQEALSRHFAASSASGWIVQFAKAVISHLFKRRGAAERHRDRSDVERRNEGFPSIHVKRAAERHKHRSDAERRNEGFPSIHVKRAAERHETVPTRSVGTRAFLRFTLNAPRSGTNTVPTRSVGTRAFLRFTLNAPRSGTNTVPTRSVGTRAFLRGKVDAEIG